MFAKLVLLFLCFSVPFVCARSGDTIVVTGAGGGKVSIRLSGLSAQGEQAKVFRETLSNDLMRSGWFRIAGGDSAATVEVLGVCRSASGSLKVSCVVRKVYGGSVYLDYSRQVGKGDVRKAAHLLSDSITKKVLGKKGMASARIAMVGKRNNKQDIYICDSDGEGLTRVTFDEEICFSPLWAPGGDSLLYTTHYNGGPGVYRLDFKNRRRRKVSALPGLNMGGAVSPDGTLIALILSNSGFSELYVKNVELGRLSRLTVSRHAAVASPVWSPDGEKIAFVSDSSGNPNVYVISRRDKRPKRLTWRGTENVSPDWGPDGRITYCSRRGGHYGIWVLDPETGDEEEISKDSADYEDPSWAPDGRHIVCSRTESHHSDLYVLDTMGDAPVRLTKLSGDWFSPDWESK